jgi:hypothetical protein
MIAAEGVYISSGFLVLVLIIVVIVLLLKRL